jgi:hypothetical protein
MSEQCVTDRGEDVRAVLGGGGDVAADGVPVLGGSLGAEPAGDLLLGLGRAEVAFGLVGGGRYVQVAGEAQHIVFTIAQDFQQDPPDRLLDGLGRSGDAPDVGEADPDAVAEVVDQFLPGLGVDLGAALGAGEIGLVDEGADRGLDLLGPVRAGIGPGAVLKIAKQVPTAELMLMLAELRRVIVLVPVVDKDTGQVGDDESLKTSPGSGRRAGTRCTARCRRPAGTSWPCAHPPGSVSHRSTPHTPG